MLAEPVYKQAYIISPYLSAQSPIGNITDALTETLKAFDQKHLYDLTVLLYYVQFKTMLTLF